MTGRLTTHVLDTAAGTPGRGMRVILHRLESGGAVQLCDIVTNADGRADRPLLEGPALMVGTYELSFHVGDYYRARGASVTSPAFLEVVPIRFGIAAAEQHYHVPLVVTPWAYSTYRGS